MTEQGGMQDLGANAGDFDDDEGGGLVCIFSYHCFCFLTVVCCVKKDSE